MRTACLRATIVGFVLAAFTGLAPKASAQQTVTLIPFNANWRYEQSGADQGTAWRGTTFSDASWALGQGLLQGGEGTAYPEPFNTTLTAPSATRITYYFRHTFNYSGSLSGISVYATNFVDDGAIIYLNGTEAGRIRMPAGAVTAATLATGGPAVEGQLDVLTITPSLLRVGQNVMAVEVHQSSTTSSDIVWGSRLVVTQPTALTITSQPQSQTAVAGDSVTFSVGVSGGPVSYQWQKDQANIPGATGSNYTINAVSIANAGTYRVIVSNVLGSRTSSNAVLTVFQDTEGPTMESAIVYDSGITNAVDVQMSETISTATALNTNNWRIVRSGTFGPNASYVPIAVVQVSGRIVRLRVTGDNWNFFDDYYIIANNVADAKGNLIAPNSVIPVSWRLRTNATEMSSFWDYYSSTIFDPNGDAIYTNNQWYKTNFVVDPSLWGRDQGIIWFDQDAPAATCTGDSLNPFQLGLFDSSTPTLFRSTFNLGTNFGTSGFISGQLDLRYFVDDGFILFLNGLEVYRYNVPAGPLTKNTKASSAIGIPTCSTNNFITVTNFLPRTNWLAAAVVQAQPDGGDLYFGLEIGGVFPQPGYVPTNAPAGSLRLSVANVGSNIRLTWPSVVSNRYYYGYNLKEASSLAQPSSSTVWLSVSNQSNGVLIPRNQPARFYKLEKGPNSGQ